MSASTAKAPVDQVGIFKACYRLVKDPGTRKLDKLIMCGWSLYLLSPIDPVPEALLGPVGLADDVGVGARAAYLVFMAYKHYRIRSAT